METPFGWSLPLEKEMKDQRLKTAVLHCRQSRQQLQCYCGMWHLQWKNRMGRCRRVWEGVALKQRLAMRPTLQQRSSSETRMRAKAHTENLQWMQLLGYGSFLDPERSCCRRLPASSPTSDFLAVIFCRL